VCSSDLLRRGDLAAAETSLRRVRALGGEAAPLAYNLGVARYRRGEFGSARAQFSATLAEPELAAASHFNRGNSAFRQAEAEPAKAETHLSEAVADFERTLTLQPGDPAAQANREMARGRLAALRQTRESRDQAEKDKTGKDKPGVDKAGAKPAGDPKAGQKPGQAGGGNKDLLAPGKSRRDLNPTETERLLNEARGRERPAGPLHQGGQNGPGPRPEKDW
jgi:tetratricopeptide (TPR) repeat protein